MSASASCHIRGRRTWRACAGVTKPALSEKSCCKHLRCYFTLAEFSQYFAGILFSGHVQRAAAPSLPPYSSSTARISRGGGITNAIYCLPAAAVGQICILHDDIRDSAADSICTCRADAVLFINSVKLNNRRESRGLWNPKGTAAMMQPYGALLFFSAASNTIVYGSHALLKGRI